MLRFKQYLLIIENRVAFLKGREAPELNDVIDHYATNADPTEGKEYTSKLLSWHKAGLISPETAEDMRDTLTDFHKLKKIKGRLQKTDINAYKTPSELEDTVVENAGESGKEKDERVKKEEIEHIHSENGVTITSPRTEEASCLLGKDTKWCTAAKTDNRFHSYNQGGKLYIMHIPQKDEEGKPKLGADNKPLPPIKYQYHPASGQFMDAEDKPANLSAVAAKHPEIANGLRKVGLGDDLVTNRQELEDKLNNGTYKEKESLFAHHPLVTPEDITKVLNNKFESIEVKKAAVQHPTAFTETHLNKLLNDPNENDELKVAAVKHPTAFTKEHMDELIDNKFNYNPAVVMSALANSPALTEEHVNKLIGDESGKLKHYAELSYALKNRNGAIKPHHVTAVLNATNADEVDGSLIRKNAMQSTGVTSDHINRILNNPRESGSARLAALKNAALTPKQVTRVMLGNPDLSEERNHLEKITAIQHPSSVRSGHIDMMLNDPQFKNWEGTKEILKKSDAVTPEHIDKVINDPDTGIEAAEKRKAVLENRAATPENIDTLLSNSSPHLRALKNHTIKYSPLLRSHHIDKLLDNYDEVKKVSGDFATADAWEPISLALTDRTPLLTSTHINRILRNPDVTGRIKAKVFSSSKVLPSHIDHILNSPNFDPSFKILALQHPTAVRPRHIDAILDNPNKYNKYRDPAYEKFKDISSSDDDIIMAGLSHPTAVRPRHIDKILDNTTNFHRKEIDTALRHPTAVTPEHTERIEKHGTGASLDDVRQGNFLSFRWPKSDDFDSHF
jgi:hypothetical protein